jgi:membrane-anchored protein YejM (alkaline phosphatase superfamily)
MVSILLSTPYAFIMSTADGKINLLYVMVQKMHWVTIGSVMVLLCLVFLMSQGL